MKNNAILGFHPGQRKSGNLSALPTAVLLLIQEPSPQFLL